MLIDDHEADNFYHQYVFQRMGVTEKVEIAENGFDALDFLKKENHLPPELIFLDINMPKMNGWEFLEEYRQLSEEQKSRVIILMLTTSVNPADRQKAETVPEINGYYSKPLNEAKLNEILERYFPEY